MSEDPASLDPAAAQRLLDDEHLRLLRIGYLVAGVVNALFALFPLIYVAFGLAMVVGGLFPHKPGEPDPAVFGWIISGVGMLISAGLAVVAILKLLTARALGRRRSHGLCQVTAALTCLGMPYGTLLGVFTFIVLSRPTVKARFDGPPQSQS